MSKKETVELVEVTIRVPKELIDLLEAENYLNYDREYFWEAAIRGLISSTTGAFVYADMMKFRKKYGPRVGVTYLPEGLNP